MESAADYLTAKTDAETGILSNITNGFIATAADFGTTVWNSMPLTTNVSTYDLLSNVSENAANFYLANKDLVETASFIGGAFVPGTLAIKSINMLAKGSKATSLFTNAGRSSLLGKAEDALRLGSEGTQAFREARNAIYMNGFMRNAAEAAGAEVFMLGLMNAHPYLEDYWDNPVQNMAISLATGGVAFGAGGAIFDGFKLKSMAGKVVDEAFSDVHSAVKSALPYADAKVTAAQTLQANIETLTKLTSEESTATPLVKEIASSYLLQEQKRQTDLLDSIFDTELRDLPKEVRSLWAQRITTDSRMIGVDNLSLYDASTVAAQQTSRSSFVNNVVQPKRIFDEKTKELIEVEDVIYHPEWDGYSSPAEASLLVRANALPLDANAILKTKPSGFIPDVDAALEITSGTVASAGTDARYLSRLAEINNMSVNELGKVLAIAPDDLFTMNAVAARLAKEPELADRVRFTVTSQKPSYKALEDSAIKEASISPTYFADVEKLVSYGTNIEVMNRKDVSSKVRNMLSDFFNAAPGDDTILRVRSAVEEALRSNRDDMDLSTYAQAVRELYKSDYRQEVLAAFRKYADEDGNVLLWRGQTGKNIGHASVSSYTPSYKVAELFAGNTTPKLYKVAVDDILGIISHKGEREILVSSPARPEVAVPELGNNIPTTKTTNEFSAQELLDQFYTQKQLAIDDLARQGIAMQAIAIKTNTPVETVAHYLTHGHAGADLKEMAEEAGLRLSSYNTADAIPAYLSKEQAPVRLKTNKHKLAYTDLKASLDTKFGNDAVLEYLDTTAATSSSKIYREFHNTFLDKNGMRPLLGMLRSGLSSLNNENLGTVLTQSSDFFLRNSAIGPLVTNIGQTIQRMATNATQRLTADMSSMMASVARNELARIEMANTLAVNAGLQGPRTYADGRLWQKVKNEVTGQLEDKPVEYMGKEYVIKTPEARALMEELQDKGRELYELKNSINKSQGKAPLSDLGFWVPSFNPEGKAIAYLWNRQDNTTKIIWDYTDKGLADKVALIRKSIPADQQAHVGVYTKAEQAMYNEINQRLDPLTMEIANVENFHSGASAPVIVRDSTDMFGEILGGYDYYIESNIRNMASIAMHDSMDLLHKMSKYNRRFFDNQPMGQVRENLGVRDTAREVMNILVGSNNLNALPLWQKWNSTFDSYTSWGLDTVSNMVKDLVGHAKFIKDDGMVDEALAKKLDYEALADRMDKAGIPNMWAPFDDKAAEVYNLGKISEHKNTSKRTIAASNALAGTMALRFGELAQPLVNAMSLPILTSLAVSHKMPSSFMGAKRVGEQIGVVQAMYEGARFSNSADGARLDKLFRDGGYYEGFVSEANAVLRESRRLEKGLAPAVENALESSFVTMMSKPADVTENILRRQTMLTGANLAKRLYPELSDAGITIFASDFMNRAMGNYMSAQRPVFFQGTMGVALGLFQTYMLTLGQNIYRHMELGDYKAIGKAAIAQWGVFGAKSMPGFEAISNAIGDHFSDDNIDLTTGTYRAIDDKLADTVLYGLPSSIGPAVYTRGDINPRVVSPFSGPGGFAAANLVGQAVNTVASVGNALVTDLPNAPSLIAQALSLQSASRPLARWSELASGYAITTQGNTVSTPEEVWSSVGIISRLLSTRPLEETKAREALYQNSFYNTVDAEHRQTVVMELKRLIREGSLTQADMDRIALEYMKKSGTPRGWQTALNKAVVETNMPLGSQLADHFKPDNPLNYMIDSLV